jgi:hypothetical protein
MCYLIIDFFFMLRTRNSFCAPGRSNERCNKMISRCAYITLKKCQISAIYQRFGGFFFNIFLQAFLVLYSAQIRRSISGSFGGIFEEVYKNELTENV